jgi:hypothetical protein
MAKHTNLKREASLLAHLATDAGAQLDSTVVRLEHSPFPSALQAVGLQLPQPAVHNIDLALHRKTCVTFPAAPPDRSRDGSGEPLLASSRTRAIYRYSGVIPTFGDLIRC